MHARAFDPKKHAVALDHARNNFYFYSRWKMLQRHGRRWMRAEHHQKICDSLMRVYRGETQRELINIPPRYSKTQFVEDFITWTLGHHPDSEYIYLSYGATLAVDKTAEMRDDVASATYQELFPGVELATARMDHWKTTAGGVVYGAGTGGSITGFGAGKRRPGWGGCLVIDDPHKPDEVYREESREDVKRNFQDTVSSRLNWNSTPIIVIMQCLHEDDLTAWLLAGGTGETWHRTCLPAINEDGTALWPELHSIEKLRQMQLSMPYTFSGQYMQRPTPVGGAYFNEGALLVDGKPLDTPKYIKAVFAVIDSAMKTGKEHDGVAVVYFALGNDDEAIPLHVLDWDLKQIDGGLLFEWIPAVFAYLEQLAEETSARMGSLGAWIEDQQSGSVLLQQCINGGLPAHEIDSKLVQLGKNGRGLNCESYVFGHKVKFTQRAYERVVNYKGVTKNHLLSQILRFTPAVKDMSADDAFDCFTYGCAIALGNREGF